MNELTKRPAGRPRLAHPRGRLTFRIKPMLSEWARAEAARRQESVGNYIEKMIEREMGRKRPGLPV